MAEPYITRPGRAGEASFTTRLPKTRRARDAVAAEPAGHWTRRGSERAPTMRPGTAPRPPVLLRLLLLVLLAAAPTTGKVSDGRRDTQRLVLGTRAGPTRGAQSLDSRCVRDFGLHARAGRAAWGMRASGLARVTGGMRWGKGWWKRRGTSLSGSVGVEDTGERPPEVEDDR